MILMATNKIRLFAQPREMEPTLSQDALRNGEYEETDKFVKKLLFTNIGKTIWEQAEMMDRNAMIKGELLTDAMINWDIRITLTDLELLLRSARVDRAFWKVPRDAFIILEFEGDIDRIKELITKVHTVLNYDLWEMNDWSRFTTTTTVSREEVIKDWKTVIEF